MAVGVGLDSAAVRTRMVKAGSWGVTSPQVLQAMGQVERHRFVDSALGNQAYEDTSLPIGMGQTISNPASLPACVRTVARRRSRAYGRAGARAGNRHGVWLPGGCVEFAGPRGLHTGAVRSPHEKARDNLRPFRLANVHLMFGDGMLGYPRGPLPAIIAAARGFCAPGVVRPVGGGGGRLVAPMAVAGGQQMLLVIDKVRTV